MAGNMSGVGANAVVQDLKLEEALAGIACGVCLFQQVRELLLQALTRAVPDTAGCRAGADSKEASELLKMLFDDG